jgi:hypothetical protein
MKSHGINRKLQYKHVNDIVYVSFYFAAGFVLHVINGIVDDSFIPRSLVRHPWEVMNLTPV